jgi:hypothetical protein
MEKKRKKTNIKGVDGKHKATSTMKRVPVMLKDGCPSCPHHHPTNPFLFFFSLLQRTDLAPLPELMELIFSSFFFSIQKIYVSHPWCVCGTVFSPA